MYSIGLLRGCNRACNTANSVLNAMHSELTALIVCWLIALAVVEVESALTMLESIGQFAETLAESMAADAWTQDARIIHLAALIDSMTCLACTDDTQLDRPLVCSSSIDMVANSTYHGDADHMRNTMADMWGSAFDAAAENNGLRSATPAALATVAEELLALTLEAVDIGTCVKNLPFWNKGNKSNTVQFLA